MNESEKKAWLAGRDAATKFLLECADNVVRNASCFDTAAYPARDAMKQVARAIMRDVQPPAKVDK